MSSQSTLSGNDANARKRLLAALHRGHAMPGRPREARDIARFLGDETKPADVLTVAGASGGDVTVAGSTVALTNAGLQKVRSHPQPREFVRTRL
jgi:hypothetical protein